MRLYKKTTSFFIAVFICVCVVLPVFKANNFFKQKEDTVQKDRTEPKGCEENRKPEEVETKREEAKDVSDKKIAANSISLPKVIAIEKPRQEFPDEKMQPRHKEEKKTASQDALPANEIKREDVIVHQPVKSMNVQSEEPEHKESLIPMNESLPTSLDTVKQDSSQPTQKKVARANVNTAKPAEKFDFKKYEKNLIEIAGLKEGERMPVLELDESNYKDGLSFYGYQLVARPQPLPKEPYYFIVNNSGIKLVNAKCPYIGTFPPALREDINRFQDLLLISPYNELAKDVQFQVFYAPMNIQMERIVRCKLKTILNSVQEDMGNVIKIQGKFKRLDTAYILIIESFQKISGEIVNVNDPDNKEVFNG